LSTGKANVFAEENSKLSEKQVIYIPDTIFSIGDNAFNFDENNT